VHQTNFGGVSFMDEPSKSQVDTQEFLELDLTDYPLSQEVLDFFEGTYENLDNLLSIDGHLLAFLGVTYHDPLVWAIGAATILLRSTLGRRTIALGMEKFQDITNKGGVTT
jgi:hypothetical protein